MNTNQWKAFCSFRSDFKTQVEILTQMLTEANLNKVLASCQRDLALADKVPPYSIETPLVYNTALDTLTKDSTIKLIVIGDNPGKDEQLAKNRRYLVGQSGKIAEGFFNRNPELDIDFRKDVIILNKTFIHSAKTKELKKFEKTISQVEDASLYKNESEAFAADFFATLLLQSQIWMAERTAKLHKELCKATSKGQAECQLWLIGYGELKNKGVFVPYGTTLAESYKNGTFADNVFVFQHFSMNRFLIDLRAHTDNTLSLTQNIENVGRLHRKEILFF
jgi:hypothetical protein